MTGKPTFTMSVHRDRAPENEAEQAMDDGVLKTIRCYQEAIAGIIEAGGGVAEISTLCDNAAADVIIVTAQTIVQGMGTPRRHQAAVTREVAGILARDALSNLRRITGELYPRNAKRN